MWHAFPPSVFNSKSPRHKLAPWTLRWTTNTNVMPLVRAQNSGTSRRNCAAAFHEENPKNPLAHRQPGRGAAVGPWRRWALSPSSQILGAGGKLGKKKKPNQKPRATHFSTAGRTAAWGTRRCPPGLPAPPAAGRRGGGDDTGGTEFFSKGRKIPLSFFSSSARGGCLYRRLVWLQWQAYIPRNDSFQHLRTTTSCRKPTVLQVRPVTHFPDNRPS